MAEVWKANWDSGSGRYFGWDMTVNAVDWGSRQERGCLCRCRC